MTKEERQVLRYGVGRATREYCSSLIGSLEMEESGNQTRTLDEAARAIAHTNISAIGRPFFTRRLAANITDETKEDEEESKQELKRLAGHICLFTKRLGVHVDKESLILRRDMVANRSRTIWHRIILLWLYRLESKGSALVSHALIGGLVYAFCCTQGPNSCSSHQQWEQNAETLPQECYAPDANVSQELCLPWDSAVPSDAISDADSDPLDGGLASDKEPPSNRCKPQKCNNGGDEGVVPQPPPADIKISSLRAPPSVSGEIPLYSVPFPAIEMGQLPDRIDLGLGAMDIALPDRPSFGTTDIHEWKREECIPVSQLMALSLPGDRSVTAVRVQLTYSDGTQAAHLIEAEKAGIRFTRY